MQKVLFLGAAMLIFSACGGGGGSSSKQESLDYTLSFKLDEQIANGAKQAVFCVDKDSNSQCNEYDAKKLDPHQTVRFTSADKRMQTYPLLAVVTDKDGSSYPVSHAPATDGTTSVLSFRSTLRAAFKAEGKDGELEMILKEINPGATFDSNLKGLIKLLSKEQRTIYELSNLLKEDLKKMMSNLDEASLKTLSKSIAERANAAVNSLILHKTGITKFYDAETDNGKDSEPDEYKGQDASFKKGKDFVWEKLDKDGKPLADNAMDYACVKDKATGLIWEIKSDDEASPNYKFSTFVLRTKYYWGNDQEFENYETTKEVKELSDGKLSFVSVPKKDSSGNKISVIKCNLNGGNDVKKCTTQNYAKYLNEYNGGKGYCGKKNWRLPRTAEFYNIADLSLTADESNSLEFISVEFRSSNDYGIRKDKTTLYRSLPAIFKDLPTKADVNPSIISDGLKKLLESNQGKEDGCKNKKEECKKAIEPYLDSLYKANIKGFIGIEDYFAYWLDDFSVSYESKDEDHPENVTLVRVLNSFNALSKTPSSVRTSGFGSCQRVSKDQKEEDLCLYKTALPVRMVAKD